MNELITADKNIGFLQAARAQAKERVDLLEKASKMKNFEQIEEAAKDFEAVFLSEVLKPMFAETNNPDPLFGGGHGEKVFNGFMVQEYGKLMAERGGIGLADYVKAELVKIQEAREESR